jgi:hypothetical protein
MGGPGTHHCSPEGSEPDPIWCWGHQAFQWFPLQMGQGTRGGLCLWGPKMAFLSPWEVGCRLGPAPEKVTCMTLNSDLWHLSFLLSSSKSLL